MNLLDLFILIPVVWGCIRGFSKGFILELTTLIGTSLGVVLAFYFWQDLADLLGQYFSFGPSDGCMSLIGEETPEPIRIPNPKRSRGYPGDGPIPDKASQQG